MQKTKTVSNSSLYIKTIETSIRIKAPAHRIYQVLTDLKSYPKWNIYLNPIRGKLVQNSKMTWIINTDWGVNFTCKMLVKHVARSEEIRLLEHYHKLGISITGERSFTLLPLSKNLSVFSHNQKFEGLLLPLFWKLFLHNNLEDRYHSFNKNLKDLIES